MTINREFANVLKKNILTQSLFCRLMAGGLVGGTVGYIVVSKIADETSDKGPFIITPLEESAAKEKIRLMLKQSTEGSGEPVAAPAPSAQDLMKDKK